MNKPPLRELVLVMPVFNETVTINAAVAEWHALLSQLGIDFEVLVIDDGSTDDTGEQLRGMAALGRITVLRKPNEGHGPTLGLGYAHAVTEAAWIFQVDSDREISPAAFPEFWRRRDEQDFLFGIRAQRVQSPDRRLLSFGAGVALRLFCGRGIVDTNVPYRLMRTTCLRTLLPLIPHDTFAPNIAIAGLALRARCRILNLPVAWTGRAAGALPKTRRRHMLAAGIRSIVQLSRIFLCNRSVPCG